MIISSEHMNGGCPGRRRFIEGSSDESQVPGDPGRIDDGEHRISYEAEGGSIEGRSDGER